MYKFFGHTFVDVTRYIAKHTNDNRMSTNEGKQNERMNELLNDNTFEFVFNELYLIEQRTFILIDYFGSDLGFLIVSFLPNYSTLLSDCLLLNNSENTDNNNNNNSVGVIIKDNDHSMSESEDRMLIFNNDLF